MRERVFIATFVIGVLLTGAVGLFSLLTELRIPKGYEMAAEEYYDLRLLGEFSGRLRDFRRAGLNYLILRQEEYLAEFTDADRALSESVQSIREEKVGLGDPALIESMLADTAVYVQDYRQAVERAPALDAEGLLEQVSSLIGLRVDEILDEVAELDSQNYLDFVRYSGEVAEGARRAMFFITIFEIAALGLIAVSGVMLLRAYRRNRMLLAQAEQLKGRLEAKNRDMESFIRIVGHDLRAPLINIKGFSDEIAANHRELDALELTADLPPDKARRVRAILHEQVPEAIGFITASADTLGRLIRVLVTVAKAGQMPVHPVMIDANGLLTEILRDFDFRIKEADARVHVETLPDCVGDRDQVRQVLSNLIDNAVKYRNPTRPLEIRVSGTRRDRQSVYTIEDNGIGIAAEDLEHIFDLFHQVKKQGAAGEGIGLATVKKLVERNGGKVEARSEPGTGSRFVVSLPAGE